MGWSLGYDSTWKRDIGYGVPAWCDHPGCTEEIDRGLAHVCGGQPYGGDHGCGLYFCGKHLRYAGEARDGVQLCTRCRYGKPKPYTPTPDHPNWMRHQLRDAGWAKWRKQNPELVAAIRKALKDTANG